MDLSIPAIALFPVIPQNKKTPLAEEAYNPEGLIPTHNSAPLKKIFQL